MIVPFIYLFIYSFNKFLLSTYYALDIGFSDKGYKGSYKTSFLTESSFYLLEAVPQSRLFLAQVAPFSAILAKRSVFLFAFSVCSYSS